MNFGELKNDENIKLKITNVHNSIQKIKKLLDSGYGENISDKLETIEKINYDLFLSYSLNTLYWIYLRTKGIDPNNHEIKNELNRIKEYMIKAKRVHEKNTIRPKLDKDASKRFIRHGLRDQKKISKEPPNKKIKLDN